MQNAPSPCLIITLLTFAKLFLSSLLSSICYVAKQLNQYKNNIVDINSNKSLWFKIMYGIGNVDRIVPQFEPSVNQIKVHRGML